MSNILPIALWYGGLLGTVAAVLFVLWALGLLALKQVTSSFVGWLLVGALVLAVASSWAITRGISLSQGNLLLKVHEPLIQLVAASVSTRAALDDGAAPRRQKAHATTVHDR